MKTEQYIIDGNELIAEFTGLIDRQPLINDFNPANLTYHISWDGLMRAVELIETIYDSHNGRFGVYISANKCTIHGTKLHLALPEGSTYGPVYYYEAVLSTKIAATWHAVVAFIKWFNEQKPQV